MHDLKDWARIDALAKMYVTVGCIGDIALGEMAMSNIYPAVARNLEAVNMLGQDYVQLGLGNNHPCLQEVEIVKERMGVTSDGIHRWRSCPDVFLCQPARLAHDTHWSEAGQVPVADTLDGDKVEERRHIGCLHVVVDAFVDQSSYLLCDA